MNSNKNQVMTCGACTVVVDENGQMTTSVGMLVGGMKRLGSMLGRRSSSRRAAATARI